MKVVCERAMWPATWRSYDAWRTPCCVTIPRPVWASRTSGSRRDAIQLTWRESCSRSDFAVALGPSPSWPCPRSWSGPTRLRSSTSRRCPRCACVSSNSVRFARCGGVRERSISCSRWRAPWPEACARNPVACEGPLVRSRARSNINETETVPLFDTMMVRVLLLGPNSR